MITKSKLIYLTAILITLSQFTFGQGVTVEIQDMTYISGGSISDCGTIDFQDNSSVTVQFGVALEKPYNMAVGNGYLKIFTKKSSSDSDIVRYSQIVQSGGWTGSPPTETFYASLSITLAATNFNTNGGTLFARYISSSDAEYNSCNYSIEKEEVPTFTISPSSVSVYCGSDSPETFTVQNVYNSPGTLTYNWQVGNGWNYNGGSAGNFTTTSNSITLVPYVYPPGHVKVTPVLNGVNQPQLTSTVGMGGFNPAFPVTGNNQLCTTATYSVNNLPTGISVTSWTVSNTNVATIAGNGNQAVLTAMGNGTVTVSAVLTNACGQTKTITKNNVIVGSPTFTGNISGPSSPLTGTYAFYSVPAATGAISYDWYFDVGNGQTGTNIDGWQIQSGQGTTGISVKVGNPGSTVVVCRATNSCGNRIKYTYVNVRGVNDPCDGMLKFSSNPMKAGNQNNKILYPPVDPCGGSQSGNKLMDNESIAIEIFNNYGEPVYQKTQSRGDFNVSELKTGFYIVKMQTSKGDIITKKLIME